MIRTRRYVLYSVISILSIVIFYHGALQSPIGFQLEQSQRPVASTTQPAPVYRLRWKEHRAEYPVPSLASLPTGAPAAIPQVQFSFEVEDKRNQVQRRRLEAVREAFIHSWSGYTKHAWGKDELSPLDGSSQTTFGGWSATLVDALDTLWIMEMKEEFEEAVALIALIDFESAEQLPLNVFETTIRYLGGLLGAYDVSDGQYPLLLHKAVEVGDMLYVAFDTPNRMPIAHWNAAEGAKSASALGKSSIAEIGSLSLEFTRLSQLSGDMKYFDAVQRITNALDQQQNSTKLPGLWPLWVNARSGDFREDTFFSLGGMADSVYEYLPKEFLMLGGLSDQYRRMYMFALQAIKSHLLFKPMTEDEKHILLPGDVTAHNPTKVSLEPQVQHLACFAGGMVGLAAQIFQLPKDVTLAQQLVDGCIWAYDSMPTGIMPEISHVVPCRGNITALCPWRQREWASEISFRNKPDDFQLDLSIPYDERFRARVEKLRLPVGYTSIDDRRFMLRPEAVESIFVLFRITGDERIREAGWRIFTRIQDAARTDIAYAAIEDVTETPPIKLNKMETFWMAETLKYFYLLFSPPNVVSLDDFVLNTEAHPFKRPK